MFRTSDARMDDIMLHDHHAQPRATRGVSASQKARQVWTAEEDRILSITVARETPHAGSISWHRVAAYLPGRNNKDCRKRWHYSIAHTIRKGTWNKEEDEKLLEAVDKYGFRWSKVAKSVGTRNGDQCWKRWYDCLDPRIDRSPWTEAEDAKLLQEVAANGRNWSQIVNQHFPNRTSLSAKNRFSIIKRKLDATRSSQQAFPTTSVSSLPTAPSPSDSYDAFSSPPRMGMMDDVAAFADFDVQEMLQHQQWNSGNENNMTDTWYSDVSLSGEAMEAAPTGSPVHVTSPGSTTWSIIYPDETAGSARLDGLVLATANYQYGDGETQPSMSYPSTMAVKSFLGLRLEEMFQDGLSTEVEGQNTMAGGIPFPPTVGQGCQAQGVACYGMPCEYW